MKLSQMREICEKAIGKYPYNDCDAEYCFRMGGVDCEETELFVSEFDPKRIAAMLDVIEAAKDALPYIGLDQYKRFLKAALEKLEASE